MERFFLVLLILSSINLFLIKLFFNKKTNFEKAMRGVSLTISLIIFIIFIVANIMVVNVPLENS